MKLTSNILICFMFSHFHAFSSTIEWVHTDSSYKGDGQVLLSDLSGNSINLDNSKASLGLSTSSSPSVMVMKIEQGGMNFASGIELANGSVYVYEGSMDVWFEIDATDFHSRFNYTANPVQLMTKQTVSGVDTHQVTIDGLCGNEAWHNDTGLNCSLSCSSNKPELNLITNEDNAVTYNHSVSVLKGHIGGCQVKSGVAGIDFNYSASISVYLSPQLELNYPFGLGSEELIYDGSYWDNTGSNCCTPLSVSMNGTYSARVEIDMVAYYVNLGGVARYLATAKHGMSSYAALNKSKMALMDGSEISIPSGLPNGLFDSGTSYATTDGSYLLQTTSSNGDLYVINESGVKLISANLPSRPVNLFSDITQK